ncbi:hypothetical protein HMPREF1576_00811 [Gardnerella pickettii JCP7719]|uniref:Uncharacterized protein n=1 Tax=Gardnerella pickettii JCP7719 TaxID=1261061 RepID=S4GM29_9BIFI|nr:hypothetical protein HMPREF1576_00811 [Gardnerella pickettii JCP7719]
MTILRSHTSFIGKSQENHKKNRNYIKQKNRDTLFCKKFR